MRLGDDERITPRESLHFVGMGRKKFTTVDERQKSMCKSFRA